MINLRADVIARNIQSIHHARKLVDEKVNKQYRSRVFSMFRALLKVSPQFSGDFTSNWVIVTSRDSDISPYTPRATKTGDVGTWAQAQPHHAGDPEAIATAYMRSLPKKFDYRDKVYFYNRTPLHIDSPRIIGPYGAETLREGAVIEPWKAIASYLRASQGT